MGARKPTRSQGLHGTGAFPKASGATLWPEPLYGRRRLLAAILVLALLPLFPGICAAQISAPDPMRDFPPLVDPNRPVWRPGAPSEGQPAETPSDTTTAPAPPEPYVLGVGDEVRVSVLGQPEMTETVKVRPDGAFTVPAVGTVHVLGRTPESVGTEIEDRMGRFLRHPHVDVLVTLYGEHRIFVMGEVYAPGGQPYYKGMSALQAVAQAGGVLSTGKKGSVLVLRRSGENEVTAYRLDLGKAMKGDAEQDMVLQPYDIVHVPRTFIARVDLAVDQYFRQMIAPFSLYIEGWTAAHLNETQLRVVNR